MVDTGTDEEIICRILASCSKNDIFYNLIPTYDQMYAEKDKKDFQAMMKSECSGDFLQAIQDVTTLILRVVICWSPNGPPTRARRTRRGIWPIKLYK